MFKIGQRVVFVDCHLRRHPDVNYPELHEIVTIDNLGLTEDGILMVILKEYPRPKRGVVNGMMAICFRPIDETFANETLERLMREIKESDEINKN